MTGEDKRKPVLYDKQMLQFNVMKALVNVMIHYRFVILSASQESITSAQMTGYGA